MEVGPQGGAEGTDTGSFYTPRDCSTPQHSCPHWKSNPKHDMSPRRALHEAKGTVWFPDQDTRQPCHAPRLHPIQQFRLKVGEQASVGVPHEEAAPVGTTPLPSAGASAAHEGCSPALRSNPFQLPAEEALNQQTLRGPDTFRQQTKQLTGSQGPLCHPWVPINSRA